MRDQNFNKNFCPSPWFHMRIQSDGSMDYCRWSIKTSDSKYNIKDNRIVNLLTQFNGVNLGVSIESFESIKLSSLSLVFP